MGNVQDVGNYMTLATQISSDITTVFLNTDDFAIVIDYYRGGAVIRSITAIAAEVSYEVASEFGFTRVETRDFIFSTGDLTFGTTFGQGYPQRGDKIIDGANTYRVTSVGGGAQVYSFEDENRLLMRVHTVLDRGD